MKKNAKHFHLFLLTTIISGDWSRTAKVCGVEKFESQEGGAFLLDEHMNALEQKIADADTTAAELATAKTNLQTEKDARTAAETKATEAADKVTAAEAKVVEAENKLNTAQSKITELEQKLAARAEEETPGSTGNENSKKGKEKYSWTENKLGITK